MVKASKLGRVLSNREGKVIVLGNSTAQLRVAMGDAPPCQGRTASLGQLALVNEYSRHSRRKWEPGIQPQKAPLSQEFHLLAL